MLIRGINVFDVQNGRQKKHFHAWFGHAQSKADNLKLARVAKNGVD